MGCGCHKKKVEPERTAKVFLMKDNCTDENVYPVTTADAVRTDQGSLRDSLNYILESLQRLFDSHEYSTLYKQIFDLRKEFSQLALNKAADGSDLEFKLNQMNHRIDNLVLQMALIYQQGDLDLQTQISNLLDRIESLEEVIYGSSESSSSDSLEGE